jgi:hypothetical protein
MPVIDASGANNARRRVMGKREESESARRQFSPTISHDLRWPVE